MKYKGLTMGKWIFTFAIAFGITSVSAVESSNAVVFYDKNSQTPYYSAIDITGVGRLIYMANAKKSDEHNPSSRLLNISGSINDKEMAMGYYQGLPDLVTPLCLNLKHNNLKKKISNIHADSSINKKVHSAVNSLISTLKSTNDLDLVALCKAQLNQFNDYLYWFNHTCRAKNVSGNYNTESCLEKLARHDDELANSFAYALIISKLNEEKVKDKALRNEKKLAQCRIIYASRREQIEQLPQMINEIKDRKADVEKSMDGISKIKETVNSLEEPLICNNTGLPNVDEMIRADKELVQYINLQVSESESTLLRHVEQKKFDNNVNECIENRKALYDFDVSSISRIKARFEVLELLEISDNKNRAKFEETLTEITSTIESMKMFKSANDCLSIPEYKENYLYVMKQRAAFLQKANQYKAQIKSSYTIQSDIAFNIQNTASFSNQEICKAGISQVMGQHPSIMNIYSNSAGIVYISYNRPSDGSLWKYKCKIDGAQVIWGNHDGRWRINGTDSRLSFKIISDVLTITETYSLGETAEKRFTKKQLGD